MLYWNSLLEHYVILHTIFLSDFCRTKTLDKVVQLLRYLSTNHKNFINVALLSRFSINQQLVARSIEKKFSGGVPVPVSRSQMHGAHSHSESLIFIIIINLKFVLTQFKDTLILYGLLNSLQHVLMAIGASDSKLLQVYSNDFTLSQILLVYVTGSTKTRHKSTFFKFHFINLHVQMYLLAKFQLSILKAFDVTAVQSSNNRKIDLYSKYWENKLQALTKTDVTYEWSDAQTQNLHHHVRHELRNGLLGKLFLLLPYIATKKSKSMKKH